MGHVKGRVDYLPDKCRQAGRGSFTTDYLHGAPESAQASRMILATTVNLYYAA